MHKRPFSIQTFFPSGDTRGYSISQIPTRTIQAIYIPRIELEHAIKNRNELSYNGLYFLFEEEIFFAEDMRNVAYIGESENVATRLRNHHKEKKEWKVAVVFTTTGEENQLTKADIKYLESYCYQKALEAGRYDVNQNRPKRSFVHEAREADLMDMFNSISDLLTFMGFPLFLPKVNEDEMQESDHLYYITNRGANGKAIYSQDGMTVLKGSQTAPKPTKSFPSTKLLDELKTSGVIDEEGTFVKDYTFTSPSSAAAIVCLASANGWKMWKNKDGKTLDECVVRE